MTLHCATVSSREIWTTQRFQGYCRQEEDITPYTTEVGKEKYIIYFLHLYA